VPLPLLVSVSLTVLAAAMLESVSLPVAMSRPATADCEPTLAHPLPGVRLAPRTAVCTNALTAVSEFVCIGAVVATASLVAGEVAVAVPVASIGAVVLAPDHSVSCASSRCPRRLRTSRW
jgi:hypothetical protein